MHQIIKPTPWDEAAFSIPTFELADASEPTLSKALEQPGHYSVKVAPLACKKLLHQYGFYYCDTLIEPFCDQAKLKPADNREVSISTDVNIDELLPLCHGAFVHGRFHRDFKLAREKADLRYDNWLKSLIKGNTVYGIYFQAELAAFIALSDNCFVLHAIAENHRGKGLAKYFWSAVCMDCFKSGINEIRSSISASNIPALNLYASLGFRFRNPLDIYHRLVTETDMKPSAAPND